MINPITREVTQIELSIDGVVSYIDDSEWINYLELNLPYIVTIPKEDRYVYDTVAKSYCYDYDDIDHWVVDNLVGTWHSNMREYRFCDQNDALYFKLFCDGIRPDYSPNKPIKHRHR